MTKKSTYDLAQELEQSSGVLAAERRTLDQIISVVQRGVVKNDISPVVLESLNHARSHLLSGIALLHLSRREIS